MDSNVPTPAPLLASTLLNLPARWLLGAIAIFVVASIVSGALAGHDHQLKTRLATRGIDTQAVVDYAFVDDDTVRVAFRDVHGKRQVVDIQTYGGGVLPKGKQMQVRYDPENPWNAQFIGADANLNVRGHADVEFTVIMLAILAMLVYLAIYRAQRLASARRNSIPG